MAGMGSAITACLKFILLSLLMVLSSFLCVMCMFGDLNRMKGVDNISRVCLF